jgi:hypothetical protein
MTTMSATEAREQPYKLRGDHQGVGGPMGQENVQWRAR